MPARVAREFVDAARAVVEDGNGRIRAVRLIETARTHAQRIGEPSPLSGPAAVRFVKRERLETGDVVWAFCRRSTETLDE